MIAPIPFDRVQYTLSYMGEHIVVKEPKNWNEDEKEYARNEYYDGIVTKFSNNLIFVEDGMRFILFVNEVYGINAEINITKEERHPQTDLYVETYSGYLDLSTLEISDTELSIKVSSGGIEQLLKTRENEQLEIDRNTTLDGKELDPILSEEIPMEGREIFLLSTMEETDKELINYQVLSTRLVPPMTKVISSDERVISTLDNSEGNYALIMDGSSHYYPEQQQFFYERSDRTKTLKLEFDLDFKIQIYPGGTKQWPNVYLEIRKYLYDENYGYYFIDQYIIHNWVGIPQIELQRLTYNNVGNGYDVTLNKDECLMFIIWRDSPFARTQYQAESMEIFIKEDSSFEPTMCKMFLAHDLGSRITEIITNKDCFYSQATGRIGLNDYTENGPDEAVGFANGFMIREFEKDETDEQNKYKPLTTSFSDFIEAMRTTHSLTVGIERIHRREIIRVEPKTYFFNPSVTVKLPNRISNVKRKVATEYYFSSLELGYQKGGSYEESMGLDEYNGKTTFTTIITRLKNIFKAVSPYRTDSYGAEFARRKTKRYYPLEDTRYDQDVFQFDLKRLNLSLRIRKWRDDFEEQPRGVYSPETAYNLTYSPANLIVRHGWLIASGLIKYPLDYIRYGSSTANSNLITKKIGGVQVSENGGESGIIIQNKDLKKPKFVPQWIEFEHIADFYVMQQIQGFSVINGKEIPNFYGLVEFENEIGKIERGYLFNMKPNGAGFWRVLKANR